MYSDWCMCFLCRECADDLKETVSSLIFAASRCGELPELQEIRGIFTSVFGKEFAAPAVELRNNCGVNPKVHNLETNNLFFFSLFSVFSLPHFPRNNYVSFGCSR